MMISRERVCEEARRWVGTPFVHQGRARGIGTDCGGLVGGVAVALGVVPPDWWQTVFDPQFGGYGRQPAHNTLQRVCESFMSPTDAPRPGDVLLMAFDREPQHLGILCLYRWGALSMVHALASRGRVVEHRLDARWRERVVCAYAMPGVS